MSATVKCAAYFECDEAECRESVAEGTQSRHCVCGDTPAQHELRLLREALDEIRHFGSSVPLGMPENAYLSDMNRRMRSIADGALRRCRNRVRGMKCPLCLHEHGVVSRLCVVTECGCKYDYLDPNGEVSRLRAALQEVLSNYEPENVRRVARAALRGEEWEPS